MNTGVEVVGVLPIGEKMPDSTEGCIKGEAREGKRNTVGSVEGAVFEALLLISLLSSSASAWLLAASPTCEAEAAAAAEDTIAAAAAAAAGGPKRGDAKARGELGPYSDADSSECIIWTRFPFCSMNGERDCSREGVLIESTDDPTHAAAAAVDAASS